MSATSDIQAPNTPIETPNQDIGQGDGVYVSTYGCQMNVNDTERMNTLLEMSNFVPVSTPEQASLIIINSCSVREKPVHKVHSEVGRYRKLKDRNPNLKIGVGGCVGQQEKKNLLNDMPLLDFVFGPDNIDELPSIVGRVRGSGEREMAAKFRHKPEYHIETLIRKTDVTAFVNITKGCDNFCSFCIVPFTRGREKSRPMNQLVDDINRLVDRGVREVTLLGQNVNSYKSDCGARFAELLRTVCDKTDVLRVRYTTSHPKDFDLELAQTMQDYREKLCDYIHLPVQSGNSEILERMNRGYTRDEYLEKVEMLKTVIPGVSLSTDIIVGFPGETEEQFLETMSMVEKAEYETLFAFKYSARPFTKASKYEDQLSEEEKSERLNRLFAAHEEQATHLVRERYQGQVLQVLVEGRDKRGNLFGRSTQNKLVHFASDRDLKGELVRVRVEQAFPSVLRGELLQ